MYAFDIVIYFKYLIFIISLLYLTKLLFDIADLNKDYNKIKNLLK